mmetsp:Transcript_58324/g.109953  ORF Transcript_58324/g.109953 Transcript_58324/m.109953 type:complete len:354 (-) Transcript_58324:14-1075(-)
MGTPSENLFVTDLPPTMDEATLTRVLGKYGTIKSYKLFPPSVRGQGNAIVSFQSVDEAKWLVENLSGNIPEGMETPITLNYKAENWKKATGLVGKGGWGGMDGGWGQGAGMAATLFIGGLPTGITDAQLQTIFSPYGTIVSHKLLQANKPGSIAAIISFANAQTAQWIVDNLNGNIPQGLTEPITVNYKKPSLQSANSGAWPVATQDNSWTPPAAWANQASNTAAGSGSWGAASTPQSGSWGAAPTTGNGSWGAPKVDPSQTLFLGDLPPSIDEATLKSTIGAYCTVVSVKMLTPGTSGAAALVSVSSAEEANWCAENLNEQIPQGLSTPIKCRLKTPKADTGKGCGKSWGPY